MRQALVHVAQAQGGLFSRQQALGAGYTEREIKALTRLGGVWVVVRHGIYCQRIDVDDLATQERWLLKDRAAALAAESEVILSHDSAARVLGIDTLEPPSPASHLTRHGPNGSRTNGDLVRHHDLLPLCIEQVDGLVATSYARTALDIGRWHGYRHGLVAVDSVRHMGVPLADLETELSRMERHPHIARARAAVRDSDAGAESVLETLGRELVASLGLGDIETQFAVRLADGRVVWCDFRVGCHMFECHGLVKLVPISDGGVAAEPAERVLWKQQARETAIAAEGLGVSRIVWADCFGAGRERAAARLRKEFAITASRHGRALPPHLRELADRHPRRPAKRLWIPDLAPAA
ncbi:hypothetical protein F4692_001084 [Nocardioides cavernae]|uniref:Type IV toxin-antitoxin system AbiEi family antitoxin domain-containing protein n=1 Tax=Nocardioides cavernae TaxID=1921566 RepID=A0A7Y9KQV3_9ACTN|nr:type IV toxin-antitoxin system AbiEi family antitoxin domain-containing protein [Nocardioides cavernae]NYE35980.1 hypothetical protein [Nocardioides cavernae]